MGGALLDPMTSQLERILFNRFGIIISNNKKPTDFFRMECVHKTRHFGNLRDGLTRV